MLLAPSTMATVIQIFVTFFKLFTCQSKLMQDIQFKIIRSQLCVVKPNFKAENYKKEHKINQKQT